MNSTLKFKIFVSALAVGAVILPGVLGRTHKPENAGKSAMFERVKAPSARLVMPEGPARLISHEGFLYEDFDSMLPGVLDSGWISSPTPGHPSDCWSVATLGSGDDVLAGTSGHQYAYILGNRNESDPYPHDAWLISPKISLKGGTEYKIEFCTYLAAGVGVPEKLDVCVLSAQKGDAVVTTLSELEEEGIEWKYNVVKWTPDTDGDYYLGFHSKSEVMSNATLLDDVRVSSGPTASFLGYAGVDMGDTDLVAGTFTQTYIVQNRGDKAMDVDVVCTSPEVRVKDVPVTVEPFDYKEITIEFTPEKLGYYVGQYTLSTSDPSHPEVELVVVSNVMDVPVREFYVEDFESGGPKGWPMSTGSVNTDFKGGHDGPRSFYVRSFYTLDEETEVGFKTHYCDMGENPQLSLWYKLMACDLTGAEQGPLTGEWPILDILVSGDLGKTWDSVYKMEPGTSTEHKPSANFQEIKVALPQYAGKRCRVKTVLRHAGNPFENDFILLIDDVALGTRPATDLKVTSLCGSSAVKVGTEGTVSVEVTNLGHSASGQYTLRLSDSSGKVYATRDCESLGAGQKTSATMKWTPETTGNKELKVTALSSRDANASNNESNPLHAVVVGGDSSVVAVGEGDAFLSNRNPIDFSAKETLVQTIYYANEIGIDAGEISSLVWYSGFDCPHLTEDFEVWLAEVSQSDFNANEIIPEDNFTKVFSGRVFMPAGEYAFTVPFDTKYDYKGGNLVVMTRKCSNEFINTKRFKVYSSDIKRNISVSTNQPGTLAKTGYEGREASAYYARQDFNIRKAPHGGITGTVHSSGGATLRDVKVSLEGTQLYTVTGSKGVFKFDEVKAGTRSLTAEKYGYYKSSGNRVSVAENGSGVCDITLSPYPRVKVKGKVSTASGDPVPEAKVVLEGYANYSAVTDENGEYEISAVFGDTGTPYNLRVEALHFNTFWNHGFEVKDTDVTYDVTLEADVQPAFNVVAATDGENLSLTWEHPLVEFRHDTGVPEMYLGWNHGHARCAIFSTYRQKMRVRQIRFYLSDSNGPHVNINLFLVVLNEAGYPDASSMKYLAQNVPFTDNGWTTLVLDEPVELENFAVGISGTGYIGLGASACDADHPFENLMHFWAGDDMYNPYDLMDFSLWTELHPMLRVYGDYLGDPSKDALHESLTVRAPKRPDTEYSVYRIDDLDHPSDMKRIGSTHDTSFADESFRNLENGTRHQYAVVAGYGNVEAAPALSAIVKKVPASVSDVESDMVTFGPSPMRESLKISNPGLVRDVRFYSLDGKCVRILSQVSELNDVSGIPAGVYMVALTCTDGSMITKKMIKR